MDHNEILKQAGYVKNDLGHGENGDGDTFYGLVLAAK